MAKKIASITTSVESATPAKGGKGNGGKGKAKGGKAGKAAAPVVNKAAENGNGGGVRRTSNGLTPTMVRVLELLSHGSKTRGELAEATGVAKGWSRILGAATKEDGGAAGEDSLESKGFVKHSKHEGDRSLNYEITAAGRKALATAQKE
jgi:hypothetical protein